MKKLLVVLLALMALLCVSAMAETVDAFSSASVADYYGAAALTGDDLMNAVNSQSGTYLVSTTNPDGSPNTAYFVFGIKKVDEKYYVQLGLAENQSKANLIANGAGLAVYAANPSGEEGAKDYTVSGARIWFEAFEDAAVLEKLNAEAGRPGAMFYEIVEVRPLG
ncbi:MAG: hypothetical protein IKU34_00945 [Clostridia bacterium]|nr:hypothetical protein [Clostridia bacterium]